MAVSLPIPELAPVISTVFPSSLSVEDQDLPKMRLKHWATVSRYSKKKQEKKKKIKKIKRHKFHTSKHTDSKSLMLTEGVKGLGHKRWSC